MLRFMRKACFITIKAHLCITREESAMAFTEGLPKQGQMRKISEKLTHAHTQNTQHNTDNVYFGHDPYPSFKKKKKFC